jgi:ribosomal protection tetracycline resistance protein
MNALHRAGTDVCEPIEELQIVIPEDTYGAVCGLLINGRATIRNTLPERGSLRIICDVPVAELRLIEQQLPGLTRGEGGWSSAFAGYIPIPGAAPSRDRVGPNPLNRPQYLAAVARM